MKKLLAVLLALCLTAALVPGTALAAGNPFQDVKPGAWYYDQVQYVYNKDLMGGTGSGTFGPNTPTNRGMVAFILYKIEGSPAVSGGSGFVDVTTQYFANAVKWASQNKIVAGTGNGRFTPNSPVTREQLALILFQYVHRGQFFSQASAVPAERFSDRADISPWATRSVDWAEEEGLHGL